MPTLRIWTNYPPLTSQTGLLRDKIPQHRVIVGTPSGPDPQLADVDIAFGQPDVKQVIELTSLRWLHVNTAGYTKYDRDDVRAAMRKRGAILTSSSCVYSEPCAQHVLALILAQARRLNDSWTDQHGARAWPMVDIRSQCTLLNDAKVLLIGFGSIGRRLAELLAPLSMKVMGVRRNPTGNESIPMIAIDKLDEYLPWADHVVNLLPASSSTNGLFDARRFAKMRPDSIFYNIGRGDTIDQAALRKALESGTIAEAYLDVMTPEPLPANDPLWTTPNCHISPHTAGGHSNEIQRVVEHFVQNLRRYEAGEALLDLIPL